MKSLFKKGVSIFLAGSMLFSLAACGGAKTEETEETAKADATTAAVSEEAEKTEEAVVENVTLKLYANYSADQEKATLDYAIAEMKKIMPEVTVEIEAAAQDDNQKLNTYAASGNLPDIFNTDGALMENILKSNALVELDSYVAEANIDEDMVDSYKSALYMADGHIYAVPWASPWVNSFYANKEVFEKNGVAIPTNYQEFLSATKALRAKDVLPYALFGKEKAWCLHLFDILATREVSDGISALDKGTAHASDAAYKKAAERLIELKNAGLFSDDVFSTTYDQAEALFVSGEAAMFMTGTWALSGLEEKMGDNVQVIYYPFADEGKEKEVQWNMSGGYGASGFAVPTYSEHKEIAAKYAVLLSRKLNDGFVVKEGGASIYKNGPSPESELGPVMAQYSSDNANFKTLSAFDWNLTNQKLKTVLEDKSQELLTGSLSVDDFAAAIDKIIDEAAEE